MLHSLPLDGLPEILPQPVRFPHDAAYAHAGIPDQDSDKMHAAETGCFPGHASAVPYIL